MKITRIETVITRPPIRHSGMLGVGALENVDSVIVRLQTDDGIEGVGESSPWPVFADNAFSIKETIDRYLAPAVIGRSVMDIETILLAMDAVHYAAHFAKAGVEMAALDAAGKALGRPVYDLLGGLVRDRVNLSYSVTNQDIAKDLDEIRWLLDQGFKVLKIKTGVLPARIEIERFAAIRNLVGDDFDIRVDFNQGGKRDQVLRLCRELEKYNPTFIEQPVKSWDLDGMRALAQALDAPIMADESVLSLEQGFQVVKCEAADIVSIKIMKPGGIVRSKKLAAICEAAGIPCYAGAMWESGIGIAASLHFACSTPIVRYGSDFYICNFLMTDDLIRTPLQVENGDILVPHGPGLGIEVDWEAVERYRLR
ncbi:mandelate racemase/muconate lactonizing enzyme family protein [Candidatus Deferrimicrobium sp.]|uniref:mandelate racemase/muconate lactonizing enzyme family protein n=1 Tax=Candidatus Deferrimicrobium sp. TaxID=3060586 RepID=UPI003C3A4936